MQYIIVDNESAHLSELVRLCGPERCTLVSVADLTNLPRPADAVYILSGRHQQHAPGRRHPVVGNDDYYRPEIELIASGRHPIIGICFGFELIAHAAGAELVKIDHAESGEVEIFPTPEGSNWFPPHQLKVSEGHRWVVRDAPPGYVSLATSKDGIEAIANLSRRIVGFQFHPEAATGPSDGVQVFHNVLARITGNE